MSLKSWRFLSPASRGGRPGDDPGIPGHERPYGIERRVLWTTSRVKGSPDPPAPYRTEPAFPQLRFEEPLALVSLPGTDRLVVAQRYGKIFSFRNDPRADRAELLLDVGKVVHGLAFHSHFINNGFLYVAYVPRSAQGPTASHASVSVRGEPGPTRRGAILGPKKSSTSGRRTGHDGGCLVFGLDGLPLHRGRRRGRSPRPGPWRRHRLDPSYRRRSPAGGPRIRRPRDNPFVGVAGARRRSGPTACGSRGDSASTASHGACGAATWTGPVGDGLLIDGRQLWLERHGGPTRSAPSRSRGPTPILPPIVEHSHAEVRSLTGGYVYRGDAPRRTSPAPTSTATSTPARSGRCGTRAGKSLAQGAGRLDLRIVSFGEDAAGELYLVDYMGGGSTASLPTPPSAGPANFRAS